MLCRCGLFDIFVFLGSKVSKGAAAAKTAATVKSGVKKVVKKIRTSTTFRRPKTLELRRTPKYPRKSLPKKQQLDQFKVGVPAAGSAGKEGCISCLLTWGTNLLLQ